MAQFKVLDELTGKTFTFEGPYDTPPTDSEIEDAVFGTITAAKPQPVRRTVERLVGEEFTKLYGDQPIPMTLQATYNWVSRQIDRPVGAVRALVSGQSPVHGFIHPEETPSFGGSAVKAWNITDPEQAKWVGITTDVAAGLGVLHLTFNTLPRAVVGLVKQAQGLYSGAQGAQMNRLKNVLVEEFKIAGMDEVAASRAADVTIAQQWNRARFAEKTPWNIQRTAEWMESNRGKLGKSITDFAKAAEEKSKQQAFTKEWFRAATEVEPRLGFEPTVAPRVYRPPELPAPTTTLQLEYKRIPVAVARTLPNEIIAPPTEVEMVKTLSRFPQKVVDQKSLEEVGNAMAKEMGIKYPIVWKFKLHDKNYVSGQAVLHHKELGTPPHEILVRVPKSKLGRIEIMEQLEHPKGVMGSRGKLPVSALQPTQGKIKKVIAHELSHVLTPGEAHKTIFWDEVDYHEANTLIKREMRKKGVALPEVKPQGRAPIIQTEHYAGYKYGTAVGVVDTYGKRVGVFEDETAAKRWIASAEKQKPVSKIKTRPEPRITLETLIDQPNLADQVIANPEGYDRETQLLAREIKRDYVSLPPITPEALTRDPGMADEVLQRPASQSPEVIEQAKEIKSEPTPEIAKPTERVRVEGDYEPDGIYGVQYHSLAGAKDTMMTGSELNVVTNELKAGRNPRIGVNIVTRIIDAFPVKGEEGSLNLIAFEDTITNLVGDVEVLSAKGKHFAKKIGTPFFIGEKYPAFKPVYTAIQDAVDKKAELFFDGAAILNPRKWLKLPDASQARLTDVIKLGNSRLIQRWFTPDELTAKFNFTPEEIEAYNAVKGVYEYASQLEVQSRKAMMDYETLTPDQRLKADENLVRSVKLLGGYVSQTRLTGDWAVYMPPDEGKEVARFFNLYEKKADAEKAVELLGPGAKLYLRSGLQREFYRHLTLADLENLIEAADVESEAPEFNALRDELKKRTFSAHWIRRQDVPGYEWNLPNILDSAVDYLEGAANKRVRIMGRQLAEAAFKDNVGKMTPELRAYARDYIEGFYNTGAIGFRWLNRFMYGWRLAFKTSWLAQNLTQPLSTTYPALGKYFKGADVEKTFLGSYGQATRYLMFRIKGTPHGLSSDLLEVLNKAHKQNVLGDQMTRFQLGARTAREEQLEKIMGLFGRAGEAVNRTHAAICGYRIATDVEGLTDKDAIFDFTKEFVRLTQFAYGKQNLPTLITGAANMRNFLRSAYTFRHYSISYLQFLANQMPWRGAKAGQTWRAIGTLIAQAGIYGLPLAGIIKLGYKKIIGRTMDNDLREAMHEAGIPDKAIDLSLHGAYSLTGVDASNLIGMGDVIAPWGTPLDVLAGAPLGTAEQLGKALWFASRGDYKRALENASPDAIRNIVRGQRYMKEGLRKASGELLSTPSGWDATLASAGFTPMSVTKAYGREEAKQTILEDTKQKSADFHEKLAKAIYSGNRDRIRQVYQDLREYNAKVPREGRVVVDSSSVYTRVRQMRGVEGRVPIKLRRKFKELEGIYGGRR